MGTTIFAEMSALAVTTGAVNLGQGFPDVDGPREIAQAAADAIIAGRGNQYPPGAGIPELRQAIAAHQKRFYGFDLDPDTQVLVTAGATEAIAAALLALMDTGDEAIAFEPYYDSYAASVAMAGGIRVPVTLRPPDFRPDLDALAAAITPRTRADPAEHPAQPDRRGVHPGRTGPDRRACLRARPAGHLRRGVRAHGVRRHTPAHRVAARHGRAHGHHQFRGQDLLVHRLEGRLGDREPGDVTAVRTVKQFLTYVSSGPFQYAIAQALALPDGYYAAVAGDLRPKRDFFCDGLAAAGFEVYRPAGTFFITTDVRPLGYADGVRFCQELPHRAGVVAIPSSVFYDNVEAAPVPGPVRVLQEAGGTGGGAGPAGGGPPGRAVGP